MCDRITDMGRVPDEGIAREHVVQTRITPELKQSVDRSRGRVKMSTWLRQAITEKIERAR